MEECNLHTIVRLPNSVFKPYASIGTNLLFFEKGSPTKDIWFWEHKVPEAESLLHDQAHPVRASAGVHRLVGRRPSAKGAKKDRRRGKDGEEVKARGYNLDIKNPHAVADDHGDPETLLAKLNAAETETAKLRDQLKAIGSHSLPT